MNIDELKKPFPPERVSWRVGATTKDKKKGMALAYIDSRDVQERLDEVCGSHNWQCRYHMAGGVTVCEIGIRINDEWVWKADGAGATDIEAEKGAMSDAFKRAAVKWGVGRYLYDLDSPWVEIDEFKQIDKGEMAKLQQRLKGSRPAPEPRTHTPFMPKAEPPPTQTAISNVVNPADRTREAWVSILAQWSKNLDGIQNIRALNNWLEVLDSKGEIAALHDIWPSAADKFDSAVNLKRSVLSDRVTPMGAT